MRNNGENQLAHEERSQHLQTQKKVCFSEDMHFSCCVSGGNAENMLPVENAPERFLREQELSNHNSPRKIKSTIRKNPRYEREKLVIFAHATRTWQVFFNYFVYCAD